MNASSFSGFNRHAIVEELARFGATVHTCSRNEAELEKCLQEWKRLGFNVTGSVCDVSSRTEREKLMERVSSLFNGRLTILVSRNKFQYDYCCQQIYIYRVVVSARNANFMKISGTFLGKFSCPFVSLFVSI